MKDLIRETAEADLEKFIALVMPQQVLGHVHKELLQWISRQAKLSHQLVLLPRDHGKSRMAAFYVAWRITKDPTLRVLYISSTSNLAVKQLKFIKDILTSPIYRYYWPEMVNVDEGKREKWTETEISIDDPRRKLEAVRDPTIFAAGLTTNIVGMHCDLSIFDDVVVPDNAYTEDGRSKVEAQYSQLASIEGTTSSQLVVGTRYHPRDLYGKMNDIAVEQFDDNGELTGTQPLYETFERTVESNGDGTGEFLWPLQLRGDGKPFGFNTAILARKRAQYVDRGQYRAQYYNDPNALDDAPISPDLFQYFDLQNVRRINGYWHYKDRRLNVFAAIDFAFTLNLKSDSSCVVVIGIDGDRNYYILEIDRFKSDKISEYFDHILRTYSKWQYKKLRVEITSAQSVIVKDLRENYIRPFGLPLALDEFSPSSRQGSKQERLAAILEPRYSNRQIWHYRGGNIQTLEDELVALNPAHDDIKDALAAAIDVSVPPAPIQMTRDDKAHLFSSRFGGVL